MSRIAVTKLHGTRNDFVLYDARRSSDTDYASLARWICDRRGAIGADGLLVVLPSRNADVAMRIFNVDGSEAEMCGNGIRCVARYLSEAGDGDRMRIETLAGDIETRIVSKGYEYLVRVRMSEPFVQRKALPFDDAVFVSMGNPHVVMFSRDLDEIDLAAVGPRLQNDPLFPEGTNVHSVRVAGEHRLDVRHFERGVGLTQACGTGAVACAASAISRGLAQSPVDVHVPGGILRIEWDGNGAAYMTGPAVRVFDTEVDEPVPAHAS